MFFHIVLLSLLGTPISFVSYQSLLLDVQIECQSFEPGKKKEKSLNQMKKVRRAIGYKSTTALEEKPQYIASHTISGAPS